MKMCGLGCSITTLVLGAVLVITSSYIGFGLIDGVIENIISSEFALYDDTLQMERFTASPFPLNFTIRAFNITNREEVLAGGVPIVQETGPYIYKLYLTRTITKSDEKTLEFHRVDHFEFDVEGSYPQTEDDILTVVNVPYNAILQVAQDRFPDLMGLLSLALNGIFGEYNSPIMEVRARDLFLGGIPICANPGIIAVFACDQIRPLAAESQSMEVLEDGSLMFSIFGYRNGFPGLNYTVMRGVDDARDLGRVLTYDGSSRLHFWTDDEVEDVTDDGASVCNTLRGTDAKIFAPFLNREKSIFAFNADICRSVELRYQYDLDHESIPALRFAANEWFLDNNEGCFCINQTVGVVGSDGCLLPGAQELYSCVGAYLVLSYPHFLYADNAYLNGVIGLAPDVETHRIFMDLEPNTGVILNGGAKAQFNIFMRPIPQIAATNNLRTTLTPIFWVQEGMVLPEEFVDELKERLLAPLRLVDILIPVLVAFSCAIFLVGIGCTVRAGFNRRTTATKSK